MHSDAVCVSTFRTVAAGKSALEVNADDEAEATSQPHSSIISALLAPEAPEAPDYLPPVLSWLANFLLGINKSGPGVGVHVEITKNWILKRTQAQVTFLIHQYLVLPKQTNFAAPLITLVCNRTLNGSHSEKKEEARRYVLL